MAKTNKHTGKRTDRVDRRSSSLGNELWSNGHQNSLMETKKTEVIPPPYPSTTAAV